MTEMDELAVRDEVDRSNCFARAMERWHASRKRPDLTDEDRVRGALQAYERQAFANELRRPSLSPAGVTEEQVEAAWKALCDADADIAAGIGFVEGVVGHNIVRAALEAAARAQPRDYTDFDDWFHEQEGTSLRSERFNGDVEWLKAAFDAGRSAQPSISTGQGEPVAWSVTTENGTRLGFWSDERAAQSVAEFYEGSTITPLYTHPSLPAGHVAVPVEPTVAMVEAFMAEMGAQRVALDDFSEPIYPAKLYRAMLAALPHNQGEGK